ncbi:hypothetical protein IMZ48_02720 [Candidatus Bathyarchaeota archaeon]|nr:hypothetical protein [Candidatus Bathyarchaeota archaeon]
MISTDRRSWPPLKAAHAAVLDVVFSALALGVQDMMMMMMRTIFFRPVGVLKSVFRRRKGAGKWKRSEQETKGVEVR